MQVEAGDAPRAEPLTVGRYVWRSAEWRLDSLDDLLRRRDQLASEHALDSVLLNLTVTGALSLTDRVEVASRLRDELAHDLRWLQTDLSGLQGRPTEADLAAIDAAGVLRDTADRLSAQAAVEGLAGRRAAAALERLLVTHRRVQQTAASA